MKLSIIIPVHNEERFIAETMRQVFGALSNVEKEVIVVNDGSSDGTADILADMNKMHDFITIAHESNCGKGEAVKTGIKRATGELLIIQDADLEYNPADIPKLLARITNGGRVAVYGNRGTRKWPRFGFHYVLGAKILSMLFNILYRQNVKDLYTCYKLFRREDVVSMNLQSTGFEFEAEVSCKFVRSGGSIFEVPIDYTPRNKKQGKHIGFMDAVSGFFTIIRYRFVS
jgi:glycosyltransferase involved in cell wall biosynthesis